MHFYYRWAMKKKTSFFQIKFVSLLTNRFQYDRIKFDRINVIWKIGRQSRFFFWNYFLSLFTLRMLVFPFSYIFFIIFWIFWYIQVVKILFLWCYMIVWIFLKDKKKKNTIFLNFPNSSFAVAPNDTKKIWGKFNVISLYV